MAQRENPNIQNIDPDCTCPKCGRPAEYAGVTDFRDQGGKKFHKYDHKRGDGALEITDDWCADVIADE
jgi:hypothetical protein